MSIQDGILIVLAVVVVSSPVQVESVVDQGQRDRLELSKLISASQDTYLCLRRRY